MHFIFVPTTIQLVCLFFWGKQPTPAPHSLTPRLDAVPTNQYQRININESISTNQHERININEATSTNQHQRININESTSTN